MKNAFKLTALFLLVTLSFTSCSKSDDNSGGTSGNIVGKWNLSKIGSIVNGQEVLTDHPNEAACAKDNTEYKTDGTVVQTEYSSTCSTGSFSGTYTKNGNTLTEIYGSTIVYTILQLDDTTLKIKDTETFQGTTTTYITVFTKN